MDNSCGVSIMEWIVTNPDAAPTATVRALKHITAFLTGEAKACGYHTILTSNAIHNTPMLALNTRLGFVPLPVWVFFQKSLLD